VWSIVAGVGSMGLNAGAAAASAGAASAAEVSAATASAAGVGTTSAVTAGATTSGTVLAASAEDIVFFKDARCGQSWGKGIELVVFNSFLVLFARAGNVDWWMDGER
jgi:hypothetical protein